MARPLEFDKDTVLNAAMGQFWREGYEASSIQKLLDVMGINRGSLYSSFGDKENLFKIVLQRYEDIVDHHIKNTLLSIDDPLDAVYSFLTERYLSFSKKQIANGCLMVNTISELSHTEPKLARMVIKKQTEVESAIAARLRQAQEEGLIESAADCKSLARFLLTVQSGLTIRSKQNPNKKEILAIIDIAMKALG
jgi:TetR/AcrR family transcriptional repressor of nem operon